MGEIQQWNKKEYNSDNHIDIRLKLSQGRLDLGMIAAWKYYVPSAYKYFFLNIIINVFIKSFNINY